MMTIGMKIRRFGFNPYKATNNVIAKLARISKIADARYGSQEKYETGLEGCSQADTAIESPTTPGGATGAGIAFAESGGKTLALMGS
jgi:hypothetical protein